MKWQIDIDADSMYVQVTDADVQSQEELPSGTIVDLDDQGHLRGVEIIHASAGWDAEEVTQRYGITGTDADSLLYLASITLPGERVGGSAFDARPSTESANMSPTSPVTVVLEGDQLVAA